MYFSFILNSSLLGLGLAMDAFSVSMANGLHETDMKLSRELKISGTYAFFQFLMPVIGWFCVHNIAQHFQKIQPIIPWISLILLIYIGLKLILESSKEDNDEEKPVLSLTTTTLLLQGIATSIDALSLGFTISNYSTRTALLASLIIAIVTHITCFFGIRIGKKFGMLLAEKAEIAGGIILILIGIRIFFHS